VLAYREDCHRSRCRRAGSVGEPCSGGFRTSFMPPLQSLRFINVHWWWRLQVGMTLGTSPQLPNSCLQKQTSPISLVIAVVSAQSEDLTWTHSSHRAGCWWYHCSWLWLACCVPGRGRARHCRYARHTTGYETYDACPFSGREKAPQESQGCLLAYTAMSKSPLSCPVVDFRFFCVGF
jgi:hypothetical protein